MKKVFTILTVLGIMGVVLAGCGGPAADDKSGATPAKEGAAKDAAKADDAK